MYHILLANSLLYAFYNIQLEAVTLLVFVTVAVFNTCKCSYLFSIWPPFNTQWMWLQRWLMVNWEWHHTITNQSCVLKPVVHCVYMLSTWTIVSQNLKIPDSLLSIVVIRYFNLTLNRNLATSSKNELPFNYYLFFWEHISVIEYIHWGQLQNRRSLIYNTSRTLYITRTSLFLFIVASLKLIADNFGVTDRIHPMIIFDLIF